MPTKRGVEEDDDDAVLEDDAGPSPSGRNSRPPQKSKLQEFKPGTIKRVRVHDFMTYAGVVTINPGPRLNLVLGPNGTGKSSLVCAICIGLGGSTKTLGRADNLADYIRRGKSSCWTEITLASNGSRDHVLRRDIRMETTSEGVRTFKTCWKLNGSDCTQKDVKELVAGLNIQFDNLCQFLPQDKVAEFALMNPKQLLDATEKAIGDAELHRQHEKLIEYKSKYNNDKQDRDNKDKQLQRLRAEHQKQQREYERFAHRQALRDQTELLQCKVLWLVFDDKKELYKETKEKLQEAQRKLAAAQAQLQEDNEPISKLELRATKLKAEKDKSSKAMVNMQRALSDNARQVEQAKAAVDDAISAKAALQEQSAAHKTKLEELAAGVWQLLQDEAKAPVNPPQQMVDEHRSLTAEADKVQDEMHSAQDAQQERRAGSAQLERAIIANAAAAEALSDVRQQRLRHMEQSKRGIRHVVEWIREQTAQGAFKGPVMGPVGMEVSCEPQFAMYVEAHIRSKLMDFVCTCRDDEQHLSRFIKSQDYYFTVAATPVGDTMPHPLGTAAQYAHVGVLHTMDEVFTAPDLIRHYLKDTTGLNRVYLLHDNADPQQVAKTFPPVRPGQGFRVTMYKSGSVFNFIQSAYNAASTQLSQNDCRPAALLGGGSLNDGVDEERRRLASERDHLLSQRKELVRGQQEAQAAEQEAMGRWQGLKTRMRALEEQMKQIRETRGRLMKLRKAKEASLAQEKQKKDPLEDEPQHLQAIRKHADTLQRLGTAACKTLGDMWATLQGIAALELSIKETEMQAGALADAATRRREAVRILQDQVAAVNAQMEAAKKVAADAKQACATRAPMTEALKELLKAAPRTVLEVEEEMRAKEVEMDGIMCSNPNVYKEYCERQKTLEILEKDVESADAGLAQLQQEMHTVRDAWLPELTQIVDHINESFGKNFLEIGCAGEVVLDQVALQREEYEKCALEIRVKFRENEELTVLTNQRQSGGERSVSTLLFLIALQGVTVTPFRVIDEINQGMDPINERKVFTQLVASACKPDTPQCFLLTPKLLPGLTFTRDITVLQIMNGPHIETHLPPMMANMATALLGARAACVGA